MAKAVINLQKESGGIVKISPVDGTGITEVTVPESGELVTKDYADLKVALTDFTGDNQGLADNGYQKLPGGLIIQWGSGNATQNNFQVNFPLTFPNKVLSLSLTDGSANGLATTMHTLAFNSTAGITSSGFQLYAMNNSGSFGVATSFRYLAIGH